MKPSESPFIQGLMQAGKPFIIARYAVGKLVVGERVNTESGKKEAYASIKHGLIIGREVKQVQETLREVRMTDAQKVKRDAAGVCDLVQEEKFIGIKPGEECVLLVKGYQWQQAGKRMLLQISGDVVPLI